jgi:hypothetical protein
MMKAFDAYSLKARYYPTVIVIAPLCLMILAVASDKWDMLKSIGVAAVSTLGLAFVMDQVGRDQGKRKEAELFLAWGGKPTTRILRHRDTSLDKTTLERYHTKLARLIEGISVPSEQQEAEDPDAADLVYDSCTTFLRSQTRDSKKFPLVFQENTNYGFRRNLWGMKPAGIVISTIGILVCSALAAWLFLESKEEWMVAAICGVVCIVLLTLWICRFTPHWVKTTADEYARQLVETCDSVKTHEQGKLR